MSAYHDLSIAELGFLMYKIHSECDAASAATQASFAKCDKGVKMLETHLHNEKTLIHKAELTLAQHKAAIIAPHILAAYEKLPSVELRLKVAKFENKRKTDECERLRAKHLDVSKSDIRHKMENKQLTKTVETLTAQLEGKASLQEKSLQNENENLQKQLALLRAQLASKTEECETKDAIIMSKQQDIDYLREDFDAYQSVHEDTWSHRHDVCNELSAALEEQCKMYKTQATTLEGNLNTLHHKLSSVAMERDCLQEQFDESIKAHKMELEVLDTSKCEGSQGCTSCVIHLERALRISRAAEVQALQLVDQVNHDRMVAWNQLHEHQTRVAQEKYASIGAWVAARQAPSVSPTLVSPEFKPSKGDENDWKITDNCDSSESSSVEFRL